MAHFAQIINGNTVASVVVIDSIDILDQNGQESESLGVDICKSLFGPDTDWMQTSRTGLFRKNYAGIGYTYDATRDAFIPPKPYPSWVLDEATCQWEAPVPMPEDGSPYVWDEDSLAWIAVDHS
jgi:hypothetical protein